MSDYERGDSAATLANAEHDPEMMEHLRAAATLWLRAHPTWEVPATSDNPFVWVAERVHGRVLTEMYPPPPDDRPTRPIARPQDRKWTPNHKLIHSLMERDGANCRYCACVVGCQCTPDVPAAVADHVLPKSRGGSDKIANRAVSCWPCNADKSDKTPTEWGGRNG